MRYEIIAIIFLIVLGFAYDKHEEFGMLNVVTATKYNGSGVVVSCATHSMYPAMTCEDNLTLTTNFDKYNIRVGTVIAFTSVDVRQFYKLNSSNFYIMHRVVGRSSFSYHEGCNNKNVCSYIHYETFYITKGDNNTYFDPEIRSSDIKYVVESINGNLV